MAIIQDILDLSQLEQESSAVNKESTELNNFIKDCIFMHQIQAKEKLIQINFKSSVEKIFQDINRDKMRRVFLI